MLYLYPKGYNYEWFIVCKGNTQAVRTYQQNISQHVDNIYKDGELALEATNKKFLLVRQEGNRQVKHILLQRLF